MRTAREGPQLADERRQQLSARERQSTASRTFTCCLFRVGSMLATTSLGDSPAAMRAATCDWREADKTATFSATIRGNSPARNAFCTSTGVFKTRQYRQAVRPEPSPKSFAIRSRASGSLYGESPPRGVPFSGSCRPNDPSGAGRTTSGSRRRSAADSGQERLQPGFDERLDPLPQRLPHVPSL